MSEVSFEDLKNNQQRVQEGESWKDEIVHTPLDTHNVNSAIYTILREKYGVTEIKHVTIKEDGDNSVISFKDQTERTVEVKVIVENSSRVKPNCS